MRPEHWLYTILLRLRSLFRAHPSLPGERIFDVGVRPFSNFSFPISIPYQTQPISSQVSNRLGTAHGTADTSAFPPQTAQPVEQQEPGDETSEDLPCSIKSMDEGARRAIVRMAL